LIWAAWAAARIANRGAKVGQPDGLVYPKRKKPHLWSHLARSGVPRLCGRDADRSVDVQFCFGTAGGKSPFQRTNGGSHENELCENSFIKRAALVNPAVIFGLHCVIVPGTSVGLKHEGSVGFQHAPLGLVNGLVERRTRDIGIQQLYKRHRATPSLLANIHRAKEVLHFEPLL